MANDEADDEPTQSIEDEAVPENDDDEEDEEDNGGAELEGFIVNDEEENEEEENEEENSEEDDEKLDEEDLDLIAENMREQEEAAGKSRKHAHQTFRRLKKAASESEDEEEDDDGRGKASKRGLFDDETESLDNAAYDDDTAWAGEGGEMPFYEGDAAEGFNTLQQQQLRELFGNDISTVIDIISGKRPKGTDHQQDEIYGDAGAPLAVTVIAKTDDETRRETIRSTDEPERLQERYKHRPRPVPAAILHEEAAWLVGRLKDYANSCPVPLEKGNIATDGVTAALLPSFPLCHLFNEAKQRQRYDDAFKGSGLPPRDEDETDRKTTGTGFAFFPPTRTLTEEVTAAVVETLGFLLNDRLEVPFIALHRSNLLVPPLTTEALWKIYQWDLIWWRIYDTKKSLLREVANIPDLNKDLAQLIRSADDETILKDCKIHLASRQAPAETTEQPSAAPRLKRRRTAAPTEGLFQKFFVNTGLRDKWAKHVMNAEALMSRLNEKQADLLSDMDTDDVCLEDEEISDHNEPPPPPPVFLNCDSEKAAMATWLESLSSDRVFLMSDPLPLITRFEGHLLASDAFFRKLVRNWFEERCAVSSITTSKGERMLDPAKSSWIPCRLFKKPIGEFWARTSSDESVRRWESIVNGGGKLNASERWRLKLHFEQRANRHREWGLELQRAETQDLVTVVLHPLGPKDLAPWRGSNLDEIRWRRGKLKSAQKARKNNRDETDYFEREWTQLQQSDADDQLLIDSFVNKIARFFTPKNCPACWKNFLVGIIHTAITREIFPEIRKELRAKMLQTSVDYVSEVCQNQLLWRLSLQPPRNSLFPIELQSKLVETWPEFQVDDDADDFEDVIPEEEAESFKPSREDNRDTYESSVALHHYPTVLSLIVEKTNLDQPSAANVHMALVNRQGVASDFRVFRHIYEYLLTEGPDQESRAAKSVNRDAQRKEVKLFESLLLSQRTRPNIVAIGANCQAAVELYNWVDHLRTNRLRLRRFAFDLIWVSTEIPLIFSQSPDAPADIRENQSTAAVEALSMGRYVQDPLAETLNLWQSNVGSAENRMNCLQALRLHPLQQEIQNAALESALLDVCCRVVNEVGVFINKIRTSKHLRNLLQFVAGFGPIKAHAFLQHFYAPVLSRRGMMSSEKQSLGDDDYVSSVGDLVFKNCASFIRLRAGEEFGMEPDDELDRLDDTRIHPIESATIAHKMCKDAQEETSDSEQAYVEATFRKPEALEELDLEAYAYILGEGGKPRMLPDLEFIKREVTNPFKDPRLVFTGPTHAQLFHFLNGDDPSELMEGALVQIQMESYDRDKNEPIWTLSSNGATAIVRDHRRDFERKPSVGTVMKARVARLNYEDLSLDVVTTPREISHLLDNVTGYQEYNPTTLSQLIHEDLESASHSRKRTLESMTADLPKTRRVIHSNYRPWTHSKLLQLMQQSESPKYYFRASETHNNGLFLYLQTLSEPFKYKMLPIHESEDMTPMGVGSELTMANERYRALDEILHSFCTPLLAFIKDVVNHEKYRANTVPKAFAEEMQQAVQRSGSRKWGLCADPSAQGQKEPFERFYLIVSTPSASRGVRCILDHLYVSAKGFRIFHKTEINLIRLLDWYKTDGFVKRDRYVSEMKLAAAGKNA